MRTLKRERGGRILGFRLWWGLNRRRLKFCFSFLWSHDGQHVLILWVLQTTARSPREKPRGCLSPSAPNHPLLLSTDGFPVCFPKQRRFSHPILGPSPPCSWRVSRAEREPGCLSAAFPIQATRQRWEESWSLWDQTPQTAAVVPLFSQQLNWLNNCPTPGLLARSPEPSEAFLSV